VTAVTAVPGRRAIYVETLISADRDELWRLTQDPAQHQRWDLRFTRIEYLPGRDDARGFRYSVRLLPGVQVAGTGTFAGERIRPDGTATSALRFGSTQRLSLIRSGTGYWRYVPSGSGIRFLTGYDYEPGWGQLGPIADHLFRPVMGWATAWSFDRLRLWLERGITPEALLHRWLAERGLRIGLCCIASRTAPPPAVAAVIILALATPAWPSVPSARRCRRRPPDRLSATYPSQPPPPILRSRHDVDLSACPRA
jgi:hypothetical protein